MLDGLIAFNRRIARWALWLAAGGLVVMTAVIGWQVYGRYVLNDTPVWSEQFSLLLMIYYILLAAAAGAREGFHLGLVFFKTMLPDPARRAIELLANLLIAAFGLFMVVYGWEMTAGQWPYPIPTVGLPEGSRFLPFPIAGVLIVLFTLEHVLRLLGGRAQYDEAEETNP